MAMATYLTESGGAWGGRQYFLPGLNSENIKSKGDFSYLLTNNSGTGLFQVETILWSSERYIKSPYTTEQIQYSWTKNIAAGIFGIKESLTYGLHLVNKDGAKMTAVEKAILMYKTWNGGTKGPFRINDDRDARCLEIYNSLEG